MKKSKKVMALILALSMVIMSGTLAFADASDSMTVSETGNTVQTGDQKLEHEHNQVTVDQACAACNGTGKVTTTETEQIGSDADVNLMTEVKEIETDCTACGGNGTIQSEKSCYGKFVKVAEKSVAPTTEADGCDYYECVICNANYKETVVKLETPNPCENPIHDKKRMFIIRALLFMMKMATSLNHQVHSQDPNGSAFQTKTLTIQIRL